MPSLRGWGQLHLHLCKPSDCMWFWEMNLHPSDLSFCGHLHGITSSLSEKCPGFYPMVGLVCSHENLTAITYIFWFIFRHQKYINIVKEVCVSVSTYCWLQLSRFTCKPYESAWWSVEYFDASLVCAFLNRLTTGLWKKYLFHILILCIAKFVGKIYGWPSWWKT
jgi:hypothetical protein